MTMRVMHVRNMRMSVAHALVTMPMGVRLARWVSGSVRMLVMRVVPVAMAVGDRLVHMLVLVPLGITAWFLRGREDVSPDKEIDIDHGMNTTEFERNLMFFLGLGVLVAVEGAGDQAALQELGRKIAMHVAATNPMSLSVDDLDPAANITRPV